MSYFDPRVVVGHWGVCEMTKTLKSPLLISVKQSALAARLFIDTMQNVTTQDGTAIKTPKLLRKLCV